MSRIYRAMIAEGHRPRLGSSARTLGVRVPEDIEPDGDGRVGPGGGGMSVAPRLLDLPRHRVPRRLMDRLPGATGPNDSSCFRLGARPWGAEALTDALCLRPDRLPRPDGRRHGQIEPRRLMALEAYREALAATQDEWILDEEGP